MVTLPPCLPPFGATSPEPAVEPLLLLSSPPPQPTATSSSAASAASARPLITLLIVGVSFPSLCKGRSGGSVRSFGGARAKRVLEPVADQVEGEDGQEQRDAREGHVPPGGVEDVAGVGDHLAPARVGRLDADPEERERGLVEDVLRDQDGSVDDDRGHEVGQDLLEEDAAVVRAERARRVDELPLA